jgi:branched-chain amino acid transport system ATP-binding protein
MSLEVHGLAVAYGAIKAVHGLSLSLSPGESVALLGPNGAGKTSTVEAIVGLLPKAAGRIILNGEDITGLPTSSVVRKGIGLVPQWRDLFADFSVEENLLAAQAASHGCTTRPLEQVFELFPVLRERRRQTAGSLSGGEQQMLAIARVLIPLPKFLILDEPSAGLAVGIVNSVVKVMQRIRDEGIGILLVEQRLEIAEAVAKRCIVLSAGDLVWQGEMTDALGNDVVRRAYFG